MTRRLLREEEGKRKSTGRKKLKTHRERTRRGWRREVSIKKNERQQEEYHWGRREREWPSSVSSPAVYFYGFFFFHETGENETLLSHSLFDPLLSVPWYIFLPWLLMSFMPSLLLMLKKRGKRPEPSLGHEFYIREKLTMIASLFASSKETRVQVKERLWRKSRRLKISESE